MAIETREQLLRSKSVESIIDDYKQKKITAETRNNVLREKARLSTSDILQKDGYVDAIWSLSLDKMQNAWDSIVEAMREQSRAVKDNPLAIANPMPSLKTLYYSIQGLVAPFYAFGEVNGAQAEIIALRNGASPSLARVINITTDIGSGMIIPLKTGAKVLAKGVQMAVGKAAKEVTADIAPIVLEKVFSKPLEMEGIDVAKAAPQIAEQAIEATQKVVKKIRRPRLPSLPNTPEPSTLGMEIFHDISSLKFGQEITKEQLIKMRALALDALREKTHEAELAFARYTTAFFSPQGGKDKINYSKQMIDLLTEWSPDYMAKGDIRGAMQTLANDMVSFSVRKISGGAGRAMVSRSRSEGGFWPGMRSFYTNLLLPFSATAAFVGNTMSAGAAILERASVSPTEGFYLAKGMTFAIGDGLVALSNTFKRVQSTGMGRFDFPIQSPIPGPLGRIINKPTEAVAGIDNLFSVIFRRGSYYASAAHEAIENGLPVGEHVRKQVMLAGPRARAWELRAKEFAEYNTFQTQLGPFARKIRDVFYFDAGRVVPGMEGFRPGVFYWPFMRSGIDLVKFSWNRTPGIQFLSAKMWNDLKAGGERAADAQGRIIMGNLIGFHFAELAKEGYITGRGPVDPALREAWLSTHEPNSVWVGAGLPGTKDAGKWVSYKGYEPLSHMLSTISDAVSIMDQLDELKAGQMAHAVTYSMINMIDQGTWWGELGDFVKIIEGDTSPEAALKILAKPAITVATGGPIGSKITKGIDPISRDARSVVDDFWNHVPGYSKDQPARIDPYGDPLVPAQTAGSPWFGILGQMWPKTKDAQEDPIKREGARLKIRVGKWDNSAGGSAAEQMIGGQEGISTDITPPQLGDKPGVPLTTDEVIKRQEIFRRLVRNPKIGVAAQTLDSNMYNSLPDAGKRAQFQSHLRSLRNMAEELLIAGSENLQNRLFEADKQALLPQLPDAERAEATQMMQEGRGLQETLSTKEIENILKWGDLEGEEEPLQLKVAPR